MDQTGKDFFRPGLVDQQSFRGIAGGGSVAFGVDHNLLRHVRICCPVNKNMTNPVRMLDHGNARMLQNRRNQSLPSPGNQKIHHTLESAYFRNAFPPLILHQRNYLGWQSLLFCRIAQSISQSPVAFPCLPPTSQKCGIPRFQAKYGTIHRHIRTGLINDSNQTDRHPDLGNFQPIGPAPLLHGLSNRIGQPGDLADSFDHFGKPFIAQIQPVQ